MHHLLAAYLPLLAEIDLAEIERDLEEGFGLMIVGMSVVFVALVVIGLTITLLGRLLRQREQAAAAVPAAASSANGAPYDAGLSPSSPDMLTVAILTAAATAALGTRVRIRRVTFLNQNTVSAWAEAGRMGVQTSHNLRR